MITKEKKQIGLRPTNYKHQPFNQTRITHVMNDTPNNRTLMPIIATPGMSNSSTQQRVSNYMPISDQIKKATQKNNRRSMLAGCLLGAFVPCAVFLLSHSAPIKESGGVFGATIKYPYLVVLILGGLIFSANSVARWGYQAFGQSWIKAIGFVILVEGTLIFAPMQELSIAALIYLVTINALATGTTLALDRKRQFQVKKDRNNPSGYRQVEITKPMRKINPKPSQNIELVANAITMVNNQAKEPPQKNKSPKKPRAKKKPTIINTEEFIVETTNTADTATNPI